MYHLDTPLNEIDMSIRLSNFLIMRKITTIREFLEHELHSYLGFRNIGPKTLQEISALQERLKEELGEQWEREKTGSLYWKAQTDCYCYGILLKDGTVIQARQITKKGFGWVDIEIETDPFCDDFRPFGQKPVKFGSCRDIISVRVEFIAAICDAES